MPSVKKHSRPGRNDGFCLLLAMAPYRIGCVELANRTRRMRTVRFVPRRTLPRLFHLIRLGHCAGAEGVQVGESEVEVISYFSA